MIVTIKCNHSPEISPEELQLLKEIASAKRYPIANFELYSSRHDDIYTGALENVHLLSPEEEMTPVVQRGELLEQLSEKGLLELDYDLPSYVKSDYVIFKESSLYKELEEAVAEAKESGFTFDIAHMTKGVARLTVKGNYALSSNK